jgi:hypothetical protein
VTTALHDETNRAVAAGARYGVVLALIAVTYVAASTLPAAPLSRTAIVLLQAVTFLFALIAAHPRRSIVLVGAVASAVAVLLAVVDALVDVASGFTAVVGAFLLALALFAIVSQLVHVDRASTELVLGAVDAYLLIGLLFAFLFAAFGAGGGDFISRAATEATNGDFLVYSYGSLSTLGAGSLVPQSNLVETLSVLEAMIGQVFLVTVIARLVSLWATAATRPPA